MTYSQIVNAAPEAKLSFQDGSHALVQTRRIVQDMLPDDATGFFIRQLTELEPKLYEVLYKNLMGMKLFPVSSAYNIAAENILFQVVDYRGKSRTVANYNVADFPKASSLMKQLSVPVRGEGSSFSYNVQDLRAAAMANQPLDQMQATAARRAIEQGVNILIWFGDIETGRVGALTDPDVPYGTVPADGAGNTTQFMNKTGIQILRDLNNLISGIRIASGGIFNPTTLVLPIKQYSYIAQTPFAPQFIGDSILNVFNRNNPGVTVEHAEELSGTSSKTLGNDVMIAFEKDIELSTVALPVPFEMFPPFYDGIEYTIRCHARTAGMIIRQPISMNIMEGI
jgi:hypothetical protein